MRRQGYDIIIRDPAWIGAGADRGRSRRSERARLRISQAYRDLGGAGRRRRAIARIVTHHAVRAGHPTLQADCGDSGGEGILFAVGLDRTYRRGAALHAAARPVHDDADECGSGPPLALPALTAVTSQLCAATRPKCGSGLFTFELGKSIPTGPGKRWCQSAGQRWILVAGQPLVDPRASNIDRGRR